MAADPAPSADPCVLIVEDNEDNQAIYRTIIEEAGHRVIVAENGELAIQAMQAEPGRVALVMLDLMMPTLGGLGFLKRKAADPALADVPVVIVSAIPDLTPLPDSADLKAVMHKPVSMPELLEVIARWAGPGAGAPQTDTQPQA